MLTFVVWFVGLAILASMAAGNTVALVLIAERHPGLATLFGIGSFFCWVILLAMIF